jgi:lipopolysaccharide transport system permease protein
MSELQFEMSHGLPDKRPSKVIRTGGAQDVDKLAGRGPLAPLIFAWKRRQLILRLVQRDVEQRFRGSALGKIWAVLAPLFKLVLYTVAFGVVIQPQWQATVTSPAEIALVYFSGLTVFDFFFECINRAPTLMIENTSYVKKIVFPLEILGWVVVGSAAFRFAIGAALVAVFYGIVHGIPPAAALSLPLLFVLLAIVALGFVWLLSSLSVFMRDVAHMIGLLMPVFMFLTPVFFPLSAAPAWAQRIFYLNPLTFILEGVRGALFRGEWPDPLGLGIYVIFAGLFLWFSYAAFQRLKVGFADVL